jgi:hypothetical protein
MNKQEIISIEMPIETPMIYWPYTLQAKKKQGKELITREEL